MNKLVRNLIILSVPLRLFYLKEELVESVSNLINQRKERGKDHVRSN